MKLAGPSGALTEFLLLASPSAEREGGVFSEYHCNLYFSKVKQISPGGRTPFPWAPAACLSHRSRHPCS